MFSTKLYPDAIVLQLPTLVHPFKAVSLNDTPFLEGRSTEYDKIVKFLNNNFNMNILSEEYVYVLSFNCKMEILGVYQLSHGNSMESKIGMRELGIFLLLTGAEKFIVAHNHPNGSSEISGFDFLVTNRMNELARMIDIDLVQHFIIGRKSYDTAIEIFEEDEEYEDEGIPFQ